MFPMKMIEDYKILSYYGEPDKLSAEVMKYLKKGWTVLGSVQVNYNPQEGQVYSQCLIKVAEK
jgi:hypothetical protein